VLKRFSSEHTQATQQEQIKNRQHMMHTESTDEPITIPAIKPALS
jgi:hypothetical protein